jgi:bifunctional DNA-binding transcriptional regulator/antitoxin component of YhaV-PrlF toxin-antitoxin module
MSYTSTVTSKNQTTIPKAIVEALKIKPSAILVYDLEPAEVSGSLRKPLQQRTSRELSANPIRESMLQTRT